MPIISSELIFYFSANMPTDDVGTSGGAIDLTGILAQLVMAANDTLEVVSSNAGDTSQTATVWARDAGGAIVTQGVTLNGTTPVAFNTLGTVQRVLRATLSGTAVGTVTFRRASAGPTVVAMAPGITKAHRLFYDSSSDPGGAKTRYEKVFLKNTNGTLTLSSAVATLTADPQADYRIGCATAKDDAGSVANRETAPGGVTFVDDGVDSAVPTGVLAAGEAIGVWVEQQLSAGAAATDSTITLEGSGTTV